MKQQLLLAAFGAFLFPASSAPAASVAPPVQTPSYQRSLESTVSATIDSGVILGKVTQIPGSNIPVRQFLGVPFARPPIGDLRFGPPQNVTSWSQPLNTNSYAAICIQDFGNTTQSRAFQETLFDNPPPNPDIQSEDCLYLNVYVPENGCPDAKSVMFWIYGGGYIFGTGSLPVYDGTSLAANQDIIVVTFNYRVNFFGYPRSPQLPLTGQNLGHFDQRLALDWVQRNIHAFGGDPKKVTIAGESAGAESVDDLVSTMPLNPPFRGAILESGQSTTNFPPMAPANDTATWTEIMQLVNCTSGSNEEILACARAVDVITYQTIMNNTDVKFSPVADNVTRLESNGLAHLAGKVAKVPTMAGSNHNDGTVFTVTSGNNVTEYLISMGIPAENVSVIVEFYAPGSPAAQGLTTGNEVISKIGTDLVFLCPSILYSNLTVTTSQAPSWLYLFNATFASTQPAAYPGLGVYHSSEISLVFGTYPKTNATAGEHGLSTVMQTAWANFIKDPESGPGWAAFPSIEVLGADAQSPVVTAVPVDGLDQVCVLWDKVYAKTMLL